MIMENGQSLIRCYLFLLFLPTSTVTENGIEGQELGSQTEDELFVIKLAFALTVPGMFFICLGVNFLCYKWGVKKGRSTYIKKAEPPDEHYHQYHEETMALQPTGGGGQSNENDPYAAYDEIKEQRQRIQASSSQRGGNGGYLSPMSQELDRPLPPIGGTNGDGNGYMTPKAAPNQSRGGNTNGKNGDSPSPPGNGGYLSPLEEMKLARDSDDSGSNKSDKSKKYQNEPGRNSPKTKGVYESIKTAGQTEEHQYIDLHTTVS